MPEKNVILSAEAAHRKLQRMAYEIAERNTGASSLVLAGIHENGMEIAKILKRLLEAIGIRQVQLATVRLEKKHPRVITVEPILEWDGLTIVLVDDVADSGKTLLYALKPFLDKHPKGIQILVLVDRAHKAFPVQPDYVGLSLSTTLQEHIFVAVKDGRVQGAWLE